MSCYRNAVAKRRVRPEWLKLDNPRLEDAIDDRDCIFWFREYLHSIKANESLSFWLEAGTSIIPGAFRADVGITRNIQVFARKAAKEASNTNIQEVFW